MRAGPVYACREDVQRGKPDPYLYVAALAGLGVAPDEAIAFEDSPTGGLAATRAGPRCVIVPNPLTASLTFSPPTCGSALLRRCHWRTCSCDSDIMRKHVGRRGKRWLRRHRRNPKNEGEQPSRRTEPQRPRIL